MNKLNRALRGTSDVKFAGILLLGMFVMCAGASNVYVGLVGMAVFTCVLVRSLTSPSAGWEPDVRGQNPYQILGVTQDADAATIRRAFRELERVHHPDAAPDDRKTEATALFIRINQAHELLSDTEKRYEYDHLLYLADGIIPPFDEAYRQIKDVDKHEIYAAYNESLPPAPAEPTAPPAPVPPQVDTGSSAPVEVELPDSVREALGMPPRSDHVAGGEGTEERPR